MESKNTDSPYLDLKSLWSLRKVTSSEDPVGELELAVEVVDTVSWPDSVGEVDVADIEVAEETDVTDAAEAEVSEVEWVYVGRALYSEEITVREESIASGGSSAVIVELAAVSNAVTEAVDIVVELMITLASAAVTSDVATVTEAVSAAVSAAGNMSYTLIVTLVSTIPSMAVPVALTKVWL